jgi:hypothetical protein
MNETVKHGLKIFGSAWWETLQFRRALDRIVLIGVLREGLFKGPQY